MSTTSGCNDVAQMCPRWTYRLLMTSTPQRACWSCIFANFLSRCLPMNCTTNLFTMPVCIAWQNVIQPRFLSHFALFIAANQSEAARHEKLRALLLKLPTENLATLRFLCQHLLRSVFLKLFMVFYLRQCICIRTFISAAYMHTYHIFDLRVTALCEENKMRINNVAIVFGPVSRFTWCTVKSIERIESICKFNPSFSSCFRHWYLSLQTLLRQSEPTMQSILGDAVFQSRCVILWRFVI